MTTTTILLDAGLAAAIAAVYAYVGMTVGRRRVEGDARLASWSFVAWWYGLSVTTGIAAARNFLGAAGVLHLPIHLTLTQLSLLSLTVALGGLLYYLLYLFTGKRSLVWWVVGFYALFYLALDYFVAWLDPVAVTAGEWQVRYEYANEPESGSAPVVLFLLALVVPHILGAVAYARLWFRVDDPTQRYRIGLVSGTILAWFGSALLASFAGFSSLEWWPVASRFIGLFAALLIYFAYRPPMWLRARYGLRAVDERHA